MISPPYPPGTRVLIPDGMAIAKAYLGSDFSIKQKDLFMEIRRNKGNNIDLNKFNDDKKIRDYIYKGHYEDYFEADIVNMLNLVDNRSRHIFFSIHSGFQMLYALPLAKYIKKRYGNLIVFGGSYFTAVDYRKIFEDFNFVDIIAVGNINNIHKRLLNAVKRSKRQLIIDNEMKNYPFHADFTGLNLNDYRLNFPNVGQAKFACVQTSDGCPMGCTFCNAYRTRKVSMFKATDVVKQIEDIQKRYKVSNFILNNQYLNIGKNFVDDFCSLLIKKKLNVKWVSYARPENLDETTIRKMKDSGCIHLSFGLESASHRVLAKMNKGYDVNKFSEVLYFCKKYNISTNVNFIVGYPGEKHKDFLDTVKFIMRYGKYMDSYKVSKFLLLYGSEVYYGMKKDKLDYDGFLGFLLGSFRYPFKKPSSKEISSRFKECHSYCYKYILKEKYPFLRLVPFSIFHFLYNRGYMFRWTILYKAYLGLGHAIGLNRIIKK